MCSYYWWFVHSNGCILIGTGLFFSNIGFNPFGALLNNSVLIKEGKGCKKLEGIVEKWEPEGKIWKMERTHCSDYAQQAYLSKVSTQFATEFCFVTFVN